MIDSKTLKIGFIGTGWTERVQIEAYRQAGFTPWGISSRKEENALRVAEKFDIPNVYKRWEALIEDPAIDIISIVTPPRLHFDMMQKAIRSNKHVICQAPFMNKEEVKELLQLKKQYPDKLAMIDFELRHTPARQKARRMLRQGEIGELFALELNYKNAFGMESPHFLWENDKDQGGGMLNIVIDAFFDQACWFAGDIDKVLAAGQVVFEYKTDLKSGESRKVSGDEHTHVLLKFKNGASGLIYGSAACAEDEGLSMMLRGTSAALKLDNKEQLWLKKWEDEQWQLIEPASPEPFSYGTRQFAARLFEFLNGQSEQLDYCDLLQAYQMQTILDAAHQSMESEAWEKVLTD